MWVAELSMNGEKSLLGSRAKRFEVCLSGNSIMTKLENERILVSAVGLLSGKERNVCDMIEDLREDSRVSSVELSGRLMFIKFFEPLRFAPVHDMDIIRLKPIFINSNGMEYWTVGCLDKNILTKFIDIYERTHEGKLLRINQEKVTDLATFRMCPSVTDEQWAAITLAISEGYYEYPRKTSLEDLAVRSGKSYSTFHAHLRKAERTVIPFFFSGII